MTRKKKFTPSKPGKWDDSEERKSFIRRRNQFKALQIDDEYDDQNLSKEENINEDDDNEDDIADLIDERDGFGDFTGWDENISNYDEDGYRNTVLRDLICDE